MRFANTFFGVFLAALFAIGLLSAGANLYATSTVSTVASDYLYPVEANEAVQAALVIDTVMPMIFYDYHVIPAAPTVEVSTLYASDRGREIYIYNEPEFVPQICELNELLEPFGNNLFVYYRNIETGFEFQFNAEIEYFGASVSKAALALMIFKIAERGDICLDTKLTFESRQERGGSGIILRTYPVGTQFTIRRLLELTLRESDNVATLILRDFIGGEALGLQRYQRFISSIGANPQLAQERIMNSYLTANEAGVFAMAIHTYLESGGQYSEEFREHMLNNQFPFLTRQVENHPPTASKTGWSRGVWHDMAIVYACSPFILVVMSRERAGTQDGTQRDRDDFQVIYEAFMAWNAYWFPGQ